MAPLFLLSFFLTCALPLRGVTPQEMKILRHIIEAKADETLTTAQDCLDEVNGKMANLLYWCFKTHEEPNSRLLGRHIFLSLHTEEFDTLLKIMDGLDNKYIKDNEPKEKISHYRQGLLASVHGTSLDQLGKFARAEFALGLTERYREIDEYCAPKDVVCPHEAEYESRSGEI